MDFAQNVEDLLQKVQGAMNDLSSTVNGIISHIPGWLSWVRDRLEDAWNWMLGKLSEFWDWFTDKLSYAGNPFVLSSASVSWQQNIGGPTKNTARLIDDGNLAADDLWEGFGAEQYRQHVPGQRDAMNSIDDDFAQAIASTIDSLQVAIVAFWAGVAVAITGLIVAIAAATAEGVSIIGLPAVPATVAAGIGIAMVALGAALAIMYSQASSARSTLAKTASGIQTWPAFTS